MFKPKDDKAYSNICEICFNKYDHIYIPKILPCCKKSYCIKCLTDWKNSKNGDCPTCRKKIPNLDTLFVKKIPQPKYRCIYCYNYFPKMYAAERQEKLDFYCEQCKIYRQMFNVNLINDTKEQIIEDFYENNLSLELSKFNFNFKNYHDYSKSIEKTVLQTIKKEFDLIYSKLVSEVKILLNQFAKSEIKKVYEENYENYFNFQERLKIFEQNYLKREERELDLTGVKGFLENYQKTKKELNKSFEILKSYEESVSDFQAHIDIEKSSKIILDLIKINKGIFEINLGEFNVKKNNEKFENHYYGDKVPTYDELKEFEILDSQTPHHYQNPKTHNQNNYHHYNNDHQKNRVRNDNQNKNQNNHNHNHNNQGQQRQQKKDPFDIVLENQGISSNNKQRGGYKNYHKKNNYYNQ